MVPRIAADATSCRGRGNTAPPFIIQLLGESQSFPTIPQLALREHPPDDLGEVAGLAEDLHLADRAGGLVGHLADGFQLSNTAEFPGALSEPLAELVHDLPRRNRPEACWMHQPGVHAVSTGPPLVLSHQKGMAVVLIRAAVDLLGQVVDQALHQGLPPVADRARPPEQPFWPDKALGPVSSR